MKNTSVKIITVKLIGGEDNKPRLLVYYPERNYGNMIIVNTDNTFKFDGLARSSNNQIWKCKDVQYGVLDNYPILDAELSLESNKRILQIKSMYGYTTLVEDGDNLDKYFKLYSALISLHIQLRFTNKPSNDDLIKIAAATEDIDLSKLDMNTVKILNYVANRYIIDTVDELCG